ncbi:hypothetical protein [Streptomyces muensis]|uniref:Uncharacterized protein n=1 Tax=Streptomyces muensis TaxID=1077944 RepID=A0A9X1TWW4_STRM4|nr:hypothetical protein [Streptomyces muensis]MCF1598753.1 hypothetical protein [Streptomyces muensis]
MPFQPFQLLQTPLPVVLTGLVFTALYAGVVLPAVWSRKPARRQAALKVLGQLLDTLRLRRRR